MSLFARVTAALDRGVDPEIFERCAVALMATVYNNVVPVEGGSDGGRDADIYGPIASAPDSRGRILVTTGDVLDNLKGSHATWQKIWTQGETFRVDQLVLVTHAPMSDAKRRNILRYCERCALPVPQIWTRDWLVGALRKNPEWRVELTGVKGRLEAVSTRPANLSDRPKLVGRTDELLKLQAAVDSPGDAVLLGLPGVGKSRLISELDGEIHVIEPRAREHLLDDLLAVEPTTVVLDDAHLHVEVLEELVRVRITEQLPFRIVTVLWPGNEERVESLLEAPSRTQLERLPPSELDELIRELGVHGFRAREAILDQSDGRPGWASTLSKLVVDGDGQRLTTGQYLLDQVASLTRAVAGTAALNDALACIAALGTASLEDLESIAALTKVSYADLVAWLEATAQGGMVARSGDSWTVFPALQSLMVAAWFFGARKTRPWSSLLRCFESDHRLDRTLLAMADLVPGREALDLADEWFTTVERSAVDAELLELVESYARLSEEAADRAASLARHVLATPCEPETTLFGTIHDQLGDAAVNVLRSAFRRTCSRVAMCGLLDLAMSDHRPRDTHPEHPLRVIKELTQYLDPDVGPVPGLRERILAISLEWFEEDPGEERWRVLAEVASHVFDPHLEGTWSDPGIARDLTIAQGLETAGSMSRLAGLWEGIDSRLRGAFGVSVPRAAVSYFCDAFGVWSSLIVAEDDMEPATSDAHRAAAVEGALRILDTLGYLAERFPAVPIRVNRQLGSVMLGGDGAVALPDLPVSDNRLARFAGVMEANDDIESWTAQRDREEESLAIELATMGAEQGVQEFQRLLAETEIFEAPPAGEPLAARIAKHVHDPEVWLGAAVHAGVRSMVGPLLTRARAEQNDVGDLVREALKEGELRDVVIRTLCREPSELDLLAGSVLAGLTEGDVASIGNLWTLETPTPMLRALLSHPLAAVRAVAALSFGEGLELGPPLPASSRPQWRTALLGASPSELPHRYHWRLEKMLQHAVHTDPELCADWFTANAEMSGWSSRARRTLGLRSGVLKRLPREQKRRICVAMAPETLVQSGFASDLLGSDESLAFDLLSEGVVDVDLLLRSLSGYRDHTVEGLAPVLIAAGVDPDKIAARTLRARESAGSVSESVRGDLKFFAELAQRRAELRPMCEAASLRLQIELDQAETLERMDRLQGW